MFENLDRGLKSKVAIGTCFVGAGIFLYKNHPKYFDVPQDWSYFNKSIWPWTAPVPTPVPAPVPAQVPAADASAADASAADDETTN